MRTSNEPVESFEYPAFPLPRQCPRLDLRLHTTDRNKASTYIEDRRAENIHIKWIDQRPRRDSRERAAEKRDDGSGQWQPRRRGALLTRRQSTHNVPHAIILQEVECRSGSISNYAQNELRVYGQTRSETYQDEGGSRHIDRGCPSSARCPPQLAKSMVA